MPGYNAIVKVDEAFTTENEQIDNAKEAVSEVLYEIEDAVEVLGAATLGYGQVMLSLSIDDAAAAVAQLTRWQGMNEGTKGSYEPWDLIWWKGDE